MIALPRLLHRTSSFVRSLRLKQSMDICLFASRYFYAPRRHSPKRGKIMGSEAIVVLVLIAIAIGFVIWVRINSHGHEQNEQSGSVGDKAETGRN